MMPRAYLFIFAFGGLMAFVVVMIALGILTAYVPRLRENRTRILTGGSGAVMAVSGGVYMMLAGPASGVFLAVMGSGGLLQAMYWHDRRVRGMIAGASLAIAGLALAAMSLDLDKILLPLRYYVFGGGELLEIFGAVLCAGAWQGWLLPTQPDTF